MVVSRQLVAPGGRSPQVLSAAAFGISGAVSRSAPLELVLPIGVLNGRLVDLAKNLVLSTLPAKTGRFYQFSREPRLAHRIANERL
jgi:hypothetical protein